MLVEAEMEPVIQSKYLLSHKDIHYTIKDRPKELSYHVNLIRACLIFDHHLIYTGESLCLPHEFLNFDTDSK